MVNISETERIPERDIYYYRKRYKNRVFSEIVAFFADEAERTGVTKRELAERLGRDPAQITRWLTMPSNLTQETISDLLLALGAEMDSRIVRFADRAQPNEMHPLIAQILHGGIEEPEPKPAIRELPPSASSQPIRSIKAIRLENVA
jgi:transcriptional regulator with XRE-family HTH domain